MTKHFNVSEYQCLHHYGDKDLKVNFTYFKIWFLKGSFVDLKLPFHPLPARMPYWFQEIQQELKQHFTSNGSLPYQILLVVHAPKPHQ